MPFGKYKGLPLDELDDDYLEWLIDADFAREPLRTYLRREWEERTYGGYDRYARPETVREEVSVPPKLRDSVQSIITAGYRTQARKVHPDIGGKAEDMRLLTEAKEWLEKRSR